MRTWQSNLDNNPLAADLDHILAHTEPLWEELRGKRLFITGGTGFFGCWLLESFIRANRVLKLDAMAVVLTRNPALLERAAPHLVSDPAVSFHPGDVRTFSFPAGQFSHIIHAAATPAIDTFNRIDPLVTFDINIEGTRRVLEYAAFCGAEKFLLASSGSVYGRQPSALTNVPDDYCGAPDAADPGSFLGESKRAAECLSSLFSRKYGFVTTIARCFSFVGPYLPLDVHYAIGNFIRDALAGGPIRVNGDGTPCRSYLYAADLTIWLWTILFSGRTCTSYNVGSEKGITISDLAHRVAGCSPRPVSVTIARPPDSDAEPNRYVPDTSKARNDLGLREWVDLETAIARTFSYASGRNR